MGRPQATVAAPGARCAGRDAPHPRAPSPSQPELGFGVRVVLAFVRAYPRKSLLVLVALVVAGVVEGVSLTALLPALSVAIDPEQADATGHSGFAVERLRAIG